MPGMGGAAECDRNQIRALASLQAHHPSDHEANSSPQRHGPSRWLGIKGGACHTGNVKVKDLISLIETDGWRQVRQNGSHRQFHHPTKPGTVTIAGKPSVDVPPGTLGSVLKQAGLKKE